MVWSQNMKILTFAMLLVGFLSGYRKGKCTGGDSCCSIYPYRCGYMEGDCDNDAQCQTGLICGTNNCPKGGTFEDEDDCCEKGKCTGGDSCCSETNKCGDMEGDCDNDDQCIDGFVCGTNNCPKTSTFEDTDDCCVNSKCTGGDSCCSETNQCGYMEGDCDNDEDCKEGFVCGTNNCPKDPGTFEDSDDCCMKDVRKSGSKWKGELGVGEGDCDPGWCKEGLVCGVDNCRHMWRDQPEWHLFSSNTDCCMDNSLPYQMHNMNKIVYSLNSKWAGTRGPFEFCGGKESLVRSDNGIDIGVAGYATQFRLKIEGKQLLGDDTAANAICLHCSGGDYICSKIGIHGSWYNSSVCSDGFTDAKVKNYPMGLIQNGYEIRKNDNGVDDTSVSDVKLYCGEMDWKTGKWKEGNWMATHGRPEGWGDWEHYSDNGMTMDICSPGSVICGLQTMVEDPDDEEDLDETGLNGLILYCCKKELLVCEPYEQHACWLAAIKNGYKHGSGYWKFASDDYEVKGCYGYTSGDNKGLAFFGKGGSLAEKKKSLSDYKTIARIPGFDCKNITINNPFYN